MPSQNFNLQQAVRPNIWSLKPYRCARDDYSSGILLDANENSYGPALSASAASSIPVPVDPSYSDIHLERYPDPHQQELKKELAQLRGLPSLHHFFLGVGSDESIDLAIRVFCAPGRDKILICPPTYGMYSVCAQVNGVEVMKVPLDIEEGRFQLRTDEIFKAIDTDPLIKIIFICSPGNPTGTLINHEDIKKVLNYEGYKGVVAVDEAYVDFCEGHGNTAASVARWVVEYPNLLVMQTLSKSFGLAGIRLGITISSCELAQIFNNTKAPYNISTTTSIIGRAALSQEGLAKMREHVSLVLAERSRLIESLKKMRGVGKILGGNNANFVMAEILDDAGKPCNEKAYAVYKQLAESEGVVVRFRGMEYGCTGCLRITVGTEEENRVLLAKMEKLLR